MKKGKRFQAYNFYVRQAVTKVNPKTLKGPKGDRMTPDWLNGYVVGSLTNHQVVLCNTKTNKVLKGISLVHIKPHRERAVGSVPKDCDEDVSDDDSDEAEADGKLVGDIMLWNMATLDVMIQVILRNGIVCDPEVVDDTCDRVVLKDWKNVCGAEAAGTNASNPKAARHAKSQGQGTGRTKIIRGTDVGGAEAVFKETVFAPTSQKIKQEISILNE